MTILLSLVESDLEWLQIRVELPKKDVLEVGAELSVVWTPCFARLVRRTILANGSMTATPTREKFRKVIERVAYAQSTDEQPMPLFVSIIPTSDVQEMFFGLHQLDYSVNGKHGCCSLLGCGLF